MTVKRARRGFSFIEILIVMIIIGLLARIAIPHYTDMKRRAIAASIMALAPIALTGLAWPLLRQRPTPGRFAAAAIGITGAFLVVGPATDGIDAWGVVCSLTALVLSALGAILTTRWRDDIPLIATTSWQLIAAGTVLAVVATVREGAPARVDPAALIGYVAVAVIATALAFLCWFAGLRHLPAGTVGLIGLLNPVTGVLLGLALAAESLTGWQLLGLLLVLTGITVGRPRRTTQHAQDRDRMPTGHRTRSRGLPTARSA